MPTLAVLVILGFVLLLAWPTFEGGLRRLLHRLFRRGHRQRYFQD
jgi:phosphotransferase system  glucose/maltose/N-acetylglucosamine-specific IIC component